VAAVCVLNTGIVGKALLLGAARRHAKKWWAPRSIYKRRLHGHQGLPLSREPQSRWGGMKSMRCYRR
jgi:hypothetical protein